MKIATPTSVRKTASDMPVLRSGLERALRTGLIRFLLKDVRRNSGRRLLVLMADKPRAAAMMDDVSAAAPAKDKPKRNRARMELRWANGSTVRFKGD